MLEATSLCLIPQPPPALTQIFRGNLSLPESGRCGLVVKLLSKSKGACVSLLIYHIEIENGS